MRLAITIIMMVALSLTALGQSGAKGKSEVGKKSEAKGKFEKIDKLRGEKRYAEANVEVLKWMKKNVDALDLKTTRQALSRFNLINDSDPKNSLKQIAKLKDRLSKKQKRELLPILKEIKTKYQLLQSGDNEDILTDIKSYHIPVTTIKTLNTVVLRPEQLNLDLTSMPDNTLVVVQVGRMTLPVTVVDGVAIIVIDDNRIVYDWDKIPKNVLIYMRPDTSIVEKIKDWKQIQNTKFGIIGNSEYQPNLNSPLGFKYKILQAKIDAAGNDWMKDSELLQEWEAFWQKTKQALDKRKNKTRLRR